MFSLCVLFAGNMWNTYCIHCTFFCIYAILL